MPSEIKITSADYNINKALSSVKKEIINLEELSRNFELDITFENREYINTNPKRNFTNIRYIKKDKTSAEEVYNRPPLGPIPDGYACIICGEIGNENNVYHDSECSKPDNSSLYLTYKGFNQIMNSYDYNGLLIDEVTEFRKDPRKKVKYVMENFPTHRREGNKIKVNNDDLSNIGYDQVNRKKGNDKVGYSTATTSFNNVVFVNYTLESDDPLSTEKRTSNIRIYSTGFIDIKGAPIEESELNILVNNLIERINNTNSVNLKNLKEVTNNISIDKFIIIPQFSYYTLFNAQFYLFNELSKDKSVNMKLIEETVKTEYDNNDNLFGNVKITETNLSLENISKQGLKTKDIFVYKFLSPFNKITLQISKYGAFQFNVSNIGDTSPEKLINQLTKIMNIFVELDKKYNYSQDEFLQKVSIYDKTLTTVSGLVPPKTQSQQKGTEVCRKVTAGVQMRPEPYTWGGKCAQKDYGVVMVGTQGGDIKETINGKEEQLYFPCCKKITNASKKLYENFLINGFPNNYGDYGIYEGYDALSGVLNPENTIPGAISFVKTPNSTWENPELLRVKVIRGGDKGKITEKTQYEVLDLESNKKLVIERRDFLRDPRSFRGLAELSKSELIEVLDKTGLLKKTNKVLTTFTSNLLDIKEIKLSFYNIITNFVRDKYVITRVPDNSELCILSYNNKNDQYIINTDNDIIKNTDFTLTVNLDVMGYYKNDIFYAMFYDKDKEITEQTEFLRNNLRGDNLIIVNFYNNIIKEANNIIKENNDSRLIFIKKSNINKIFTFYDNTIPSAVNVQVIKKEKSDIIYGYLDRPFDNKPISTVDLPMASSRKVKEGDYINIIPNLTNKLRPVRFLSSSQIQDRDYQQQRIRFTEIFDPFLRNYFTIYDGDKIRHFGYTITYNGDKLVIN